MRFMRRMNTYKQQLHIIWKLLKYIALAIFVIFSFTPYNPISYTFDFLMGLNTLELLFTFLCGIVSILLVGMIEHYFTE